MRKPPRSWQTQRRLKSGISVATLPADAAHRIPAPRKLTLLEMQESVSANAPDKRTSVSAWTASDNPRPTRAYEEQAIDALVTDLVAARAARGHRKAMRRPSRRRGQSDLFDVVRLHLRRLCRRVLNDRCRDGLEPPQPYLLFLALERYLEQQCWHLVYHHDYGEQRAPQRLRSTYLDESRTGHGAIYSVALSAARYALSTWTPDYTHEMQRLGSIGGKIGKRKPMWTDDDLDTLASLAGQTKAQQAKHLGVSTSSIDRMRRALRDRG